MNLSLLGLLITAVVCMSLVQQAESDCNDTNEQLEELQCRISNETRLTRILQRIYENIGTSSRPVGNQSLPVVVRFGLAPVKIYLNEKDEILEISAWTRHYWNDDYLKWNSSDFGGVEIVHLPYKNVWIPDITLYNTDVTKKMMREANVNVESNGNISWIPQRIFHSACPLDVSNYPFDIQRCHMEFASWIYDIHGIDLRPTSDVIDMANLKWESEMDIISKGGSRNLTHYPCCQNPYVKLILTFTLKRKFIFSSFILTVPCVLLACMCLVIFWLPTNNSDRTNLALSLISSLLLLLLILVQVAPPTSSSLPKLCIYYCNNMVLILLSVVLSTIVINIGEKGEALLHMPMWIKKCTMGGLSKVLCPQMMKRLHAKYQARALKSQDKGGHNINIAYVKEEEDHETEISLANTVSYPTTNVMANNVSYPATDVMTMNAIYHNCIALEKRMQKIEERSSTGQVTDVNEEITKLEWQCVANTLDKVFFIFYVIANIVSFAVFFPHGF